MADDPPPQAPPAPPSEPAPKVGRTPWDLGAELVEKLGIGVLVLVGFFFALWQFRAQEADIRDGLLEKARDAEAARLAALSESQEQLRESNESLRESSESLVRMNKDVVQNLSEGFEKIQALQKELEPLREQRAAEQEAAERAAEERKQVEGELKEKLALLRTAEANAERAKSEAKQAERQLAEARTELEKFRERVLERYGEFREDVERLVEAVEEVSDDLRGTELPELADEIRTSYLIDVHSILAPLADEPGEADSQAIAELAGMSREALETFARSEDNPFEYWGAWGGDEAYVMALGTGLEYGWRGYAVFELSDDRVVEVRAGDRFLFVSVPSEDDWDDVRIHNVYEDLDGELDSDQVDVRPDGEGRISLARLAREGDGSELETLRGEAPSFPLLELDAEVDGPERRLLRRAIADSSRLEYAEGMLERARSFDASDLLPAVLPDGSTPSAGLRESLVRVLDAAVRRDPAARRALSHPSLDDDWGVLGAAVLGYDFELGSLAEDPPGDRAAFRAAYLDRYDEEMTAEVVLARTARRGSSPWALASARTRPAPDSTSAASAAQAAPVDDAVLEAILDGTSRHVGSSPTEAFRAEVRLPIPDASAAGTSSTLEVSEGGPVRELAVVAEIRHTYMGDLVIELVAPSGASCLLLNRRGGSRDTQRLHFDPWTAPSLRDLTGVDSTGSWTLRVADLTSQDTGTLEGWTLELVR